MNELENNASQSFVSGLSYKNLYLVSEDCYSKSIDILYDILPKNSLIKIYQTVKMEVEILDSAFDKIKSLVDIDFSNPMCGEVTCTKSNGKIEVNFTIGQNKTPIPLNDIDRNLLLLKVEKPLIIEKGMDFNDLPHRTIKIMKEREKEKEIISR